MEYEWRTTGIWNYNHLISDESVYCFSRNLNRDSEFVHMEDLSKPRCGECKNFEFEKVKKTTCANVLHINRKIFI